MLRKYIYCSLNGTGLSQRSLFWIGRRGVGLACFKADRQNVQTQVVQESAVLEKVTLMALELVASI